MSHRCHSELYYHVTWATKYRKMIISQKMFSIIKEFVIQKCKKFDFQYLAIGYEEDHIHLLLRMRVETFIPKFINEIKGGSSFYVNKKLGDGVLRWQNGYGIFSVSKENIPKIKNYIKNQKKYHSKDNIQIRH